ncbi:MAG: LamG domain-containing protein [Chitinophagaceae bacterium]
MRFQDITADCDISTPARTDRERFVAGYGDLSQNSTAYADTTLVKLNEWITIIYTYDGFESRLYINGKLENITLKKAGLTPNSLDLFIGSHEDPQYRYFFNGVIDEIRIYNKALCAEQVAAFSDYKK